MLHITVNRLVHPSCRLDLSLSTWHETAGERHASSSNLTHHPQLLPLFLRQLRKHLVESWLLACLPEKVH